MLDFLEDIGALAPWFWRGWAYLFSSSSRSNRHSKWAENGTLYAVIDVAFSLAAMALEIFILVLIVRLVIG